MNNVRHAIKMLNICLLVNLKFENVGVEEVFCFS